MTDRDGEKRLSAIAGFREEARRLEAMGLLRLDAAAKRAIARYHDEVLRDLEESTGLRGAARPSAPWTMRLAAALGALTLAGLSLALLDRVWGGLATWLQVLVAMAMPPALVLLAEALAAAGRDRWFVTLTAWFAVFAFMIDLRLLAVIGNHPLGFEIAFATGAFAAALGHRHLGASLTGLGVAIAAASLAALVALADGAVATALGHRLEPFLVLGGIAYGGGRVMQRWPPAIGLSWRIAGLVLGGTALLLLARPGTSMLGGDAVSVATIYAAAAALVFAALLIAGLYRRRPEDACGGLLLLWLLALERGELWLGERLPPSLGVLLLLLSLAVLYALMRLVHARFAKMGEGP